MVTKVCVLRSGGDFRPEHVQMLARMVPGLVCLSDVEVPGVPCMPLKTDWPGWWAKLEAFGPSIDGDMLLMDLDTVVLEMPEMPEETTVLRDWLSPDVMNSSFMYVTAADRARVWGEFVFDARKIMARHQAWPLLGDQGFLQGVIGGAAKWGDEIRSYKVHCADGLPDGTQVVCFHGKPRPWDVRADWMPEEEKMQGHFAELALKHKGKRIVVMGGAPSLKADLDELEFDIAISTNAHGIEFVRPDYIVAMDERNSRANCDMGAYLKGKTDAPIISPHPFADYRLSNWPQNPRFVLSGMIGAWLAWFMGAEVVLLAGMDGYAGQSGYKDEARKIARDIHCPVRVVGGGPLTCEWPAFSPAEKFGEYVPSTAIDAWLGKDGLITVRARKACLGLAPGETGKFMRHECARMLKHRMCEEVSLQEPVIEAPAKKRGRSKKVEA